jgi:hypothetical protein
VIGAALDEHIALLEQGLAFVHHGVNFTLQHDDVIHGAGDVHHRIAMARDGRVTGADR